MKEEITLLQEKNRHRKALLKHYKQIHEKDLNKIDTLEKTIEYAKRIEKDYKTKVDRAIEYIHRNHKHFGIDEKDYVDVTGLLIILQGSDKEC